MKLRKKGLMLLLLSIGLVSACSGSSSFVTQIDATTEGRFSGSTTAGNLIATAMKEENSLDVVFYPSEFLNSSVSATVKTGMTNAEVTSNIIPMYDITSGTTSYGTAYPKTTFLVGTVSGSVLRQFIIDRCMENADAHFQVAGVKYDITIVGGLCTSSTIELEDGNELDDDANYKIAVDSLYYNYFPGYRYRNSFDQNFYQQGTIDAQASLKTYLAKVKDLANITTVRSKVRNVVLGTVSGTTPIYSIQGTTHLSPYRGKFVTTSGVITATGSDDFGNKVFYIQDSTGDGNVLTHRMRSSVLFQADRGM